jgi:hypothetical protein
MPTPLIRGPRVGIYGRDVRIELLEQKDITGPVVVVNISVPLRFRSNLLWQHRQSYSSSFNSGQLC